MIFQIDENTIHNLQTTATYTQDLEEKYIGSKHTGYNCVVRCDGKRVATGEGAEKFWDLLKSMVTQDLTQWERVQPEEVTD